MSSVPYIIETAHPDYKRPGVLVQRKQITLDDLETDFVKGFIELEKQLAEEYFDALVNELYYNVDDPMTQESLDKFFENYYRESYMDNEPISISYFINGKWHRFEQPPIEILAKKYEKFLGESLSW